jgi:hypothetical protein
VSEKNLYDEIARVAYELYEKCGCIHGHDIEHWFEAERLVITRLQSETGEKPGKPETPRKASRKTAEKTGETRAKPKRAASKTKKTSKK